jgi:hypothetical protein
MIIKIEQIFNDNLFETLYPDKISNLGSLIIDIKEGQSLDLSKNPELEEIVRNEWESRVKDAQSKGVVLNAGPQFRLSSYIGHEKNLTLYLAPSNYRELIGTNGFAFTNPEVFEYFLEAGMRDGNASKYLSGVLAICASIESVDNKYFLMKRSDKVAEYPGSYHTVGGHPDPKKFQPIGQNFNPEKIYPELIDMKIAIEDEIQTELGLNSHEYSLEVTGLVRFRKHLKPELTFSAKSYMTAEEILKRPKSDKWEGIFSAYTIDELERILENDQYLVPSGKAAYLFHLYINQKKTIE